MRVDKLPHQGLWLADYALALDGTRRGAAAVLVTHAHADHVPHAVARGTPVLATPPTAALMRCRGFVHPVTELAFFTPVTLGSCRVTLLPAGHILGSAMVYVEATDGTLLYTGDCRRPPAPTSDGFEAPDAVDILVVEATYGLPLYRWPDHATVFAQIRAFAEETLAAGGTPAFLAYNLGKAQEVLYALAPLGRRVQVHSAAYPLCRVYEAFGVPLGRYVPYTRHAPPGDILVMPLSALPGGMGQHLPLQVAYVSGWATLNARRTQLGVDALVPLSDHLDFFELIAWCRQLGPRHVYLTHTTNPEVALHYLGQAGIAASHLAVRRTEEDA